MSTFSFDANGRLTAIRTGSVIGGKYDPSGVTADTWYRLLPSGNDAQKVASTELNYKSKLNIGTLRSDITNANLIGWFLKILNVGYQAAYEVLAHNGGLLTLASRTGGEVNLENLPTNVEYVIYPEILNPLVVHCKGANGVEFGRSEDEVYSLLKVDSLGDVETGENFIFPYACLDRLCFRYATVGSTDRLSWGEHYVV